MMPASRAEILARHGPIIEQLSFDLFRANVV
jgi:hypothetical protein